MALFIAIVALLSPPPAALQARFTDAVEMSKCSAVALMLALFSLRH